VIDEAIELARAGRARASDIILDYQSVGTVRIDGVEIQQVLVNLLSNAFDAVSNEPDGRITIRTERDSRIARVSVRDSGQGISPQLVGRLFRPFESTKENGLGIGLAISQAIAHAHGGELSVDPGGRGSGATFTLSLPVGEDADSHPESAPRPMPAAQRSRAAAGTRAAPRHE
jgi:C4-dicarboxylate-specific signal transduction histidine kinase